ncbi:hypothetical protein, partial [Arenimonas sp. GDDSR-1]|uniref:hypothetical protein n=1 Tax=Arenimonas sp. GDDSR-1 TaxID=2950125 RepID=UPI0026160D37
SHLTDARTNFLRTFTKIILLAPKGSRFGHFVSKWSHSMADLFRRVNILKLNFVCCEAFASEHFAPK